MGNSASASLPYSIGNVQVANVNDGWTLHDGQQKNDGSDVSVFVAKKPTLSKTAVSSGSHFTQLQPAMHHFVNCKKLRHPHILQVLATLDTDNPNDASMGAGSQPSAAAASSSSSSTTATTGDLIIVTEKCIPLDVWLQQRPAPEEVAWGLEAMVRALTFLHTSASLCHACVTPSSFYVTPSGDVKLWNFCLTSNITTNPPGQGITTYFRDYESLVTPQAYRSPERQEGRWDVIATTATSTGVHGLDSFSLGVLFQHVFTQLGSGLPPPLVKAVQRLQTPNLRMRPRLQPLLKCPIFDTTYQKLQLQLQEFPVQSVEDKTAFWQNLTPSMQAGLIPQNLAVYKLLAIMKSSIQTVCESDSLRTQEPYRREGTNSIS